MYSKKILVPTAILTAGAAAIGGSYYYGVELVVALVSGINMLSGSANYIWAGAGTALLAAATGVGGFLYKNISPYVFQGQVPCAGKKSWLSDMKSPYIKYIIAGGVALSALALGMAAYDVLYDKENQDDTSCQEIEDTVATLEYNTVEHGDLS
ncbi:MAG: hypothetical protein O3C05_01310 [Proteobacteria bacterium]|nr:hypothetical protein [Pseudomonadota bacterium]